MASLKKTPLFDYHFEVGAKMVPVGSWTMPLQFGDGSKAEFLHSLEAACITDFGCCNIFRMIGSNADKVRELVPEQQKGTGKYFIWQKNGHVIDIPLVVRMDENDYLCMFAPSSYGACAEFFAASDMQELSDIFGSIAVWGAGCDEILSVHGVAVGDWAIGEVRRFEIDKVRCIGVKTALTEDCESVMIFCDREKTDDVWIALFNTPDVWAAGFGAWNIGQIAKFHLPFNMVNCALPIGFFQWSSGDLPKIGEKLKICGKNADSDVQVIYSMQLPHADESFLLVNGKFDAETVLEKVENDGGNGIFRAALTEK